MNKKVLFVIVGSVLLMGGAFAYVLLKPNLDRSDITVSSDSSTKQKIDTPSTKANNETIPAKGAYVDYSEQTLKNTDGTKLLFFHASWCPQCRSIEASINEGGIPDGVTVFKVDYDSHQDLRQKYGVTIQTTFVKVDNNGDKIDSYVAYDDPVFSSVEKALLP